MTKQQAQSYVESKQGTILDASHKIWEYAELSLKEEKSAACYISKLKEEGFEVTENLCGISTAFKASYGSSGPKIGILAEFDALSGLSQKGASVVPEEIVPNGSGHGCGHAMLGAASFGAALGIKHYLEETGVPGTVIFYGCPGEEGGASKAVMARDGEFDALDAALTWHPGDVNAVSSGTWNSCIQAIYQFKGIAAHAAGNPEMGRSALDAVEVMNIGVQFLREHMKSECRIHYSILNAGGPSPNVVQPKADVLYMIRSPKVKDALELEKRVDKIAEGAALITETTFNKIFVDGCSGGITNYTLEQVLYDNMKAVGPVQYTDEEWEYAKALQKTYPASGELPDEKVLTDPEKKQYVAKMSENGTRALNDYIFPLCSNELFSPGSSDVGDVSWNAPTAQFHAVTFPSGSPGHSWQNVSCGVSTIGDKGVMFAAKVLCGAAIDLYEDPKTLAAAKEEFLSKSAGGYFCPVPEGASLYIIE